MERKETIQELKDLNSILYNAPAGNIYTAPAGYFEGFAGLVLNRIKALDAFDSKQELSHLSPFIASLKKENVYSVPQGYFTDLAESLMTGIRVHEDYLTANEELLSLSPLLSSINKQNLYSIPDSYFENFGKDVNLKTESKPLAKTISLVSRKWFRFAAAAVVIGFVALTGISLFFNKSAVSVSNPHEWVKANMKKVSTDDINTFIQPVDDQSVTNATASAKTTDINELMKDVSDKDIQNFLNETTVAEDNNEDLLLN
ncbi:MAG: hypothetical protein JSS70_12135 [Bacteroidetes bacterium]|nr:hypothetical protein [Bacteroidota bacterium]